MNRADHLAQNGFALYKDVLPNKTLYEIVYWKETWDLPVRGHDVDGKYHTQFDNEVRWANYWTHPLSDHRAVQMLRNTTDEIAKTLLKSPVMYHCDASVLTELSTAIRPHVDTPHRHEPWNDKIDNRLAIQMAAPLHEFKSHCGTTAFYPGSHLKHWDIKACYSGHFDNEFLKGHVQPPTSFGDVAVWDARTLHSQMPNLSERSRYLLLFNYVEERIVDDLMDYENSLV